MCCVDILIWSVFITELCYGKPPILAIQCADLYRQMMIKSEEMGKWWVWKEINGQREDKLNKSLYVGKDLEPKYREFFLGQ